MFLVAVILLAIIIGHFRKGSLSNVLRAEIRVPYLFVLALMLFLIVEAGSAAGWEIVVNYSIWIRFLAHFTLITSIFVNIQTLDIWPLAILIGSVMNFTAIFSNVGRMPVSLQALEIAGIEKAVIEASSYFELAGASTSFPFLGGIIPIPLPGVFAQVISIGTLLIAFGAFGYIQELMLGIEYVDDEDEDVTEEIPALTEAETEEEPVVATDEETVAENEETEPLHISESGFDTEETVMQEDEVTEEDAEDADENEADDAEEVFTQEEDDAEMIKAAILGAVAENIPEHNVAEEDIFDDEDIDDYDDYDGYFDEDDADYEDERFGDLFREIDEQLAIMGRMEEDATSQADTADVQPEKTAVEEETHTETVEALIDGLSEDEEYIIDIDDFDYELDIDIDDIDTEDIIPTATAEEPEVQQNEVAEEAADVTDDAVQEDTAEENVYIAEDDALTDETPEELSEDELIPEETVEETETADGAEAEEVVTETEDVTESESVESAEEYEETPVDEAAETIETTDVDEPVEEPVSEDAEVVEDVTEEAEEIIEETDVDVTENASGEAEEFVAPVETAEYVVDVVEEPVTEEVPEVLEEIIEVTEETEEVPGTAEDDEEFIIEGLGECEDICSIIGDDELFADDEEIAEEPAVIEETETSEEPVTSGEDIGKIPEEQPEEEYAYTEPEVISGEQFVPEEKSVITEEAEEDDEELEAIFRAIRGIDEDEFVGGILSAEDDTSPMDDVITLEYANAALFFEELDRNEAEEDESGFFENIFAEEEQEETEDISAEVEEVIELVKSDEEEITAVEEIVRTEPADAFELIRAMGESVKETSNELVLDLDVDKDEDTAEVLPQTDSQYIVIDGKIVENPNYKLRRSSKTRFAKEEERLFGDISSGRRRNNNASGKKGKFSVKEDE